MAAVAVQQRGVISSSAVCKFFPTSVRVARSTVGAGFSSTKSREGRGQVHNRAWYKALFHAGEEEGGQS